MLQSRIRRQVEYEKTGKGTIILFAHRLLESRTLRTLFISGALINNKNTIQIKMNLFYAHVFDSDRAVGDNREARHLHKVIRKNAGDLVNMTAGDGKLWRAEVLKISRGQVIFKPLKLIKEEEPVPRLALALALTKNKSRVVDVLEKGVQAGMSDLYLFQCERSLRDKIKAERLERVAVSAMKQCMRLTKVRIHQGDQFLDVIRQLKEDYQRRYICKIGSGLPHLINQPADDHTVMVVGPEGDFTETEYATAEGEGFIPVSLGSNRLRTEMAGITAIVTMQARREMIRTDMT